MPLNACCSNSRNPIIRNFEINNHEEGVILKSKSRVFAFQPLTFDYSLEVLVLGYEWQVLVCYDCTTNECKGNCGKLYDIWVNFARGVKGSSKLPKVAAFDQLEKVTFQGPSKAREPTDTSADTDINSTLMRSRLLYAFGNSIARKMTRLRR